MMMVWDPKIRGAQLVCIFLFFLMPNGPAEAEDRALLVGLERYGNPDVNPTPGGVEDARTMAHTLRDRFSFPADSVRLLLDEQATSEAILRNFQEWLIEETGPGDRVFFLYAGHGSQLPDQNGDEEDGYDETLAPYDVDPVTGDHQIRDDVIDSLIAQLSGRRAVLLFDSCHSGTLTRSLDSSLVPPRDLAVRYLPRPDQIQEIALRRGASGSSHSYRIEASQGSAQNAFDAPAKAGKMTGIIVISASGPGQLAYPVEVNRVPRGALSYLFQKAVANSSRGGLLEDLKGTALTSVESTLKKTAKGRINGQLATSGVDDLHQAVTIAGLKTMIEQGMKELQESGRLPGDQRPYFEVLAEKSIEQQPLWGDHMQAAASAMTNPIDSRQVTLRTADDRVLFRGGEEIVFEAWTDRPGYLYLLVFSEHERATCIFPNPVDRRHRIGPSLLRIPTNERYRLPAQEPFGRDLVVAVVADEPLPLCEKVGYTWNEVFARVSLNEVHGRLRNRARRGIGFELTDGPQPPSWQTAMLVLQTTDNFVDQASQ